MLSHHYAMKLLIWYAFAFISKIIWSREPSQLVL